MAELQQTADKTKLGTKIRKNTTNAGVPGVQRALRLVLLTEGWDDWEVLSDPLLGAGYGGRWERRGGGGA